MRLLPTLTIGLLCFGPVFLWGQSSAEMTYPSLAGYGGVFELPDPIVPSQGTRLIIDLTGAAPEPGQVNPALERVARLINLYGLAGIPPEQLDLAVVVHGPALAVVLDSAGHRQFLSSDNPNRELIQRLDAAGVRLMVCGQALMHRGYGVAHLLPEVKLSLSAITTLAEYQRLGYYVLDF